jgi:fimbrial chaperone protein
MLSCGGLAQAAELSISPLRVGLAPGQNSGNVNIVNHGNEPIAMQVEAFAWTQDGGLDLHSETAAVLAVPPIFELAPGETQLIRIGLLVPRDSLEETAYRLVLTELKSPVVSADNRGLPMRTGLRMRMRVSIPVFVLPEAEPRPTLDLDGFVIVDGMAHFRLQNHGNTHVRLERLQLLGDGGRETGSVQDFATYLLPGVSRKFVLRMPDHGRVEQVRVRTSAIERIDFPTSDYRVEVTDEPMVGDTLPAVGQSM